MIVMISPEKYGDILRVCASQEAVKKEVLKNHDDNLWWPMSVEDWRTRMIVAGLSSRISYNMIKTFQKVVDDLNSYGYDTIASISEKKFRELVRPIGLTNMRVGFWRSVVKFIEYLEKHNIDIKSMGNDDLIYLIQDQVYGSSYKVAQCCALYVRGYHCGIMPVDSGMLNLLCPAIGFPAPNSPTGYEVIRKQLEALTACVDCRKIAIEEGYSSLSLPNDRPLTWWAHLVLVYYKRFFSRKKDPAGLPLRTHPKTKNLVAQTGLLGGVKNIILEGLDGTGKTTITDILVKIGFKKMKFKYNPQVENLFVFYRDFLEKCSCTPKRFVFDRIFLSEAVYGPTFRGKSRLTKEHIISLLQNLKQQNTVLIYLYAPLNLLLKRVCKSDVERLSDSYSTLMEIYESIINLVAQYLPVVRINSGTNTPEQIFFQLMGFEMPKKIK